MKNTFSPVNFLLLMVSGFVCSAFLTSSRSLMAQSAPAELQPIPVNLVADEQGNWQLMRDGKPYWINGAGGEGSLTFLAECGGNSTRTWGVGDETMARLDEAHARGLSVAVGIWLEHERKGFDYSNPEQTEEQAAKVLAAVEKYKHHPAVLIWGIGNEMEGELGDNPAIWAHIESIARRIHEIDPYHPTMTVIAEIGGQKVSAIHEQCPGIDIIGINSYGGTISLAERYAQAGGTKPYLVTEFGPNGAWETGKNSLGVVDELTSTEKAKDYREKIAAIQSDKRRCLGSYAFLWGNKQEATETWFGLLLPTGDKTGGVDALMEGWKGVVPDNRCPEIESLQLVGPNEIAVGSLVTLRLKCSDPENDPLSVEWVLMRDADKYITMGDFQESPPDFPDAIVKASAEKVEVRMPESPGLYRIYAYVRDAEVEGSNPFAPTPKSLFGLHLGHSCVIHFWRFFPMIHFEIHLEIHSERNWENSGSCSAGTIARWFFHADSALAGIEVTKSPICLFRHREQRWKLNLGPIDDAKTCIIETNLIRSTLEFASELDESYMPKRAGGIYGRSYLRGKEMVRPAR